jgi:membrane protein DedA with SNARE-associated domain
MASAIWNPKQIARAERWMDRYGVFVVFFARVTEHFTLPVVLVAGASEMRFRRFIIANTAGSICSASLLLWIGIVAERKWPWLHDWITKTYQPWAAKIGIASLVLLVLVFVLGRFVKPKDEDQDETTTPSQGDSSSVADDG